MNDANLQACSPRAGRSNGFIPGSFRAMFRSASSLASSVRSVSSSVASTINSVEEDRQREQLQWACFDKIELPPAGNRRVLLLTYANGFQVWDVDNADDISEVVSKRDGPAAFLRIQPHPVEASDDDFKSARPLLLVVTSDFQNFRNGGFPNGYNAVIGSPPPSGENIIVPTLVKFYSLQTHSYVHTLRFRTAIFAIRCSSRVVAVSLATQVYCFDAATLQSTFSVLTYPSPQPGPSGFYYGYGAVAVGPRWLAYAANQPLLSITGRVSPQHLSPSPGVSPSTSPANGSLVAHYAKESSKQLAAGIVTLGDLGYKALSRYYSEGAGSPISGSPFLKSSSNGHPEFSGTVIVRDFVTKAVVSQFRAHESPLSALSFDPTGTLLVTASIHGHSINVFRIMPVSNLNSCSFDTNSSHVHLYKLSRGMTNAVIQDIAFSEDSHWIVVSSSRGTNHLFAISPFGGAVGKSTHGASLVDPHVGPVQSKPWWSNLGPLRSNQHALGPPPPMMGLSVVSRIKNGSGGWRGTVSGGGGAAAAGWNCSSFGAVAVVFHNGAGHDLDNEVGQGRLKEQLWVLSPSGHLIRHALHLSAGTEGYSDNKMASDSQKEALDLKVTLEPLQKWDLCRRPNWMEREESIKGLSHVELTHEEARNPRILMGSSQNEGVFEGGETFTKDMTSKEMRQWFLSNAEVQMHHLRPPIWANSQFSFHVLSGVYNEGIQKEDSGGEIEIEKVVSLAVEVRKRDLVPVFDMFKDYQFGEDVRKSHFPLKDGLNLSGLQSAILFGAKADVKGFQAQHFGSGSSNGSGGSLFDAGSNNDRALCLQSQRTSTSSLRDPGTVFCAEERGVQGTRYPTVRSSNAKKDDVLLMAGSPPMDIPHLGHQPSFVMGSQNGIDFANVPQKRERDLVSSHAKNVAAINDMPFTCEARHADVGCLFNGGLGNHESLECTDPAVTRAESRWVACIAEEACPSQMAAIDENSENLTTAIQSHLQNIDLQGYDAAAEDVESTDGNSKSEDFAGEQGEDGFEEDHTEDGWEGAMFPFVEDC
ncbi:hypothetical protein GOP47_0016971 [Adiantum capillus-veneris]|uniref:BCAS3 domain-containing protein n=1 Tax=Adiantum capillus-veneris TaxID=13818 RepID=A0A9D4UJM8_ADICA|nr:hypothetical protein GOP47_0016971 [Adiantum capillus-veneris]